MTVVARSVLLSASLARYGCIVKRTRVGGCVLGERLVQWLELQDKLSSSFVLLLRVTCSEVHLL
jgi:hypothetical protein